MEKKTFEKPTIEKVKFNLSDKEVCVEVKSGLFHDGGSITGSTTAGATSDATSSIFGK